MAAERLQKVIAAAGIASRRAAERLIAEGRVKIDGQVVRRPGVKADPQVSEIRVDGQRLRPRQRPRRYVILNKPIGCLTTRSDPKRRPTVMDLVPAGFRSLVPVGRLDGNSSGLILLTDDGELAYRVTHPRFRLPKVYLATVRGLPEEKVLDRACRGIRVDGQHLRLDRAEVLTRFPHRSEAKRRSRLMVTLRGGRNREIRRVLSVLGHPVLELHRTRIGSLVDTGLAPGRWRRLAPAEVERLREAIRLATGRKKATAAIRDGGPVVPATTTEPGARGRGTASGVTPAFVVAVDGPAGSGKSSVARGLAERFGLPWFNTGASVRAVALAGMRAGVNLDDGPEVRGLAYRVVLDPAGGVYLDGEEVSRAVRAPEVSRGASRVAVHPELREVLVGQWRRAGSGGGVMEGRDIGTVVFPDAPVKIFLDARPEVRAARRSVDEGDRDVGAVAAEMRRRDRTDSGRAAAPLRRAADAHHLDTSDWTLEETIHRAAALVAAAPGAPPPKGSREISR